MMNNNLNRHNTASLARRVTETIDLSRRDSSNLARRETGSAEPNLARRETEAPTVARRNTDEEKPNGNGSVQVNSDKLIFKKMRGDASYLKMRRKTQHIGQMQSRSMRRMTDDQASQNM